MVLDQEMITYDKKADGTYSEQRHMGVLYVPLTDEKSQYAKGSSTKTSVIRMYIKQAKNSFNQPLF